MHFINLSSRDYLYFDTGEIFPNGDIIMKLKEILSKSRFVIVIPVVLSLLASVAAFIWGAVKTFKVIYVLFTGEATYGTVGLIAIMDTYLIATALFIFAIGMYELFVEEIDFPEWLVMHDLHSLKAKLASVIILVMAVTFLEHLVHWTDAWDTFLFAAAIALVTASLIAYGHFGGKD